MHSTLPLLLVPALVAAPPRPPGGGLSALVEAELAFAHRAQEVGYPRAFLETFAEDAVVFTPRPTPGKAHYAKAPQDRGRLRWYPSWARVSGDGSLGLTLGPWQYTPEGEGPAAHGHFVTVWRRKPGGWEVVLDAGVPHAAATVWELPVLPRTPAPARALPAPGQPAAALDQAFTRDAAASGVPGAYAAWGGELRFLREQEPPGRDLAARREDLARLTGHTWAAEASGASRDGWLAYSYGYRKDPAGLRRAVFVRFWRAEAGSWRLDLDLELGLPPEDGTGK